MNKQMIYQLSNHLFNLEVLWLTGFLTQNDTSYISQSHLRKTRNLPVQITEIPQRGAIGLRSQTTPLEISLFPYLFLSLSLFFSGVFIQEALSIGKDGPYGSRLT